MNDTVKGMAPGIVLPLVSAVILCALGEGGYAFMFVMFALVMTIFTALAWGCDA